MSGFFNLNLRWMVGSALTVAAAVTTQQICATSAFANPNLSTSGNVRERFFEALAAENDFGAYEIDVENKYSGALILTGKVSSAASLARAEELARGLQGVPSVDNKLAVSAEISGVNAEKQRAELARVQADINARKDLGTYTASLSARGDEVSMVGEVPSAAVSDKLQAIVAAGMTGARIKNQLRVVKVAANDEEITARVRRTLAAEGDLYSRDITVTARGGVVTVRGARSDHKVRDYILAVVLNVDGVTDIRSELR